MHHALYDHQAKWSEQEDVDGALVALTESVGLDRARFVDCLNGRKALERVLGDLYDAQGVVRTTPTFVVLYGGKGTTIAGRRTPEQFASYLRKIYELVTKDNTTAASNQPGG